MMSISLEDHVTSLPGIGGARGKVLQRLGIQTAQDLLQWFPRTYEDRTRLHTIRDAPEDLAVCVRATVISPPRTARIRKGLDVTKMQVTDGTSCMDVTFFNQNYVSRALHSGEEYIFCGRVERVGNRRAMTNPVFERAEAQRFTGRLMPVYPLTAGITNNLMAGLTLRVVEDCAGQVPDLLPQEVRLAYGLAQSEFCYHNIHFPDSWESLALARRRFIFEELFYLSMGLAFLKERRTREQGPVIPVGDLEPFYRLCSFALTGAQKRAIAEAAADMASGRPMNRLLQGDVGSGKTVAAAACCYLAAMGGYQSALMAPTELLAQQHYRTLSKLLEGSGIRVALLTGSLKAAEKRRLYAELEEGEIQLVVGTHALLSQGVSFARLGFVITDEQHRFGVGQRAALTAKAGREDQPHVLVMSATPIPRTLALMVYGDLDLSVLDEMPPGRQPVETYLIGENKRLRLYSFIRKLAAQGRQSYIVCPAVEESEQQHPTSAGMKTVTEHAALLKEQVFPDLRVGMVHGRMKAQEKEMVMVAFAEGKLDVLVATTVIEVGVDVPNAVLMVVENAERFGLSQLHQLRGRVGRGEYPSYCVLIPEHMGEESRRRLEVLITTNDGFKISEEDLKLRGPGDFFGARQHGLPQLKVADLAGDMRLLKEAQLAAQDLLNRDPDLTQPQHRVLRERLAHLFADNPGMFN